MIIKPEEITDVIHNPWMGWGLWAGPIYFDGTRRSLEQNTTAFVDEAPLFDWVLLDWMWADLEPEEGRFCWDELDAIIHFWANRGKQINLRIWVTDDPGWDNAPGAPKVCPDWVYGAGLRGHEYKGEGNTSKREPDYADPSFQLIFLPRLRNLLQVIADRFDRPHHPFNFLGCMGYGQWGEWHTMWSNYHWPTKQLKHETLASLINVYAETFKHIDLAVSYCFDTFNIGDPVSPVRDDWVAFRDRLGRDDPEDFKYRQALDVAMAHGFLLGRHGFIDGLEYVDRRIMETEWQRRAFYAEANWCYTDIKDQENHGTLEENIDYMLEWHSNYGHFYTDAASYQRTIRDDPDGFARGLRKGGLGYRFVLTEAAYPEKIPQGHLFLLRQKWINQNVGRCYKRYPLKMYLLDKAGNIVYAEADRSFDQTGWVRNQDYDYTSVFHLPANLPPGDYDLRIAMVDWDGNPSIRLGIAGEDAFARYHLGMVSVQKSEAAFHSFLKT